MASKDYRRATGALDISVPWFRSIAGLWLLSIAALSFVSVDPSFSGPKQWVVDGSMHAAIFLALALVPGLFVRSASTLIVAAGGREHRDPFALRDHDPTVNVSGLRPT